MRAEKRAAKRTVMLSPSSPLSGVTIRTEPDGSVTATSGNLTVALPPVVAEVLKEMSERK